MIKFIKWLGIIFGGIVALLAIASILLYLFLPLNAIKDFAAAQLSAQLKREVKIAGASFNLFSGFKLKGLTISNRKGFDSRPFVSADAIEMRYAFWPLFKGQIIIPSISLVRPQILVEKSRRGEFNFSDILSQPAAPAKAQPKKEQTALPPINLIINSFSISKGKVLYVDYGAKSENEIKDINLNISGITLSLLKPIDIRASAIGTYLGKEVPLAVSGSVGIDPVKETIKIPNLAVSVAGETLNISAAVTRGLLIDAKLSSQKLAIDPFLAIFAAAPPSPKKTKPEPGALTQSLKSIANALPAALVVNADLDLRAVTLSRLKLDTVKMSLGLQKRIASLNISDLSAYNGKLKLKGLINLPALSYNFGQVELKGFNSTPFINDLIDSYLPDLLDMKNKVEGRLDVKLMAKGSGVEMPQVFQNLTASGVVLLAEGRLKRLKSLGSIGEQYNLNLLKTDMLVSGLRAEAALADRKLEVKKLTIQDTDAQVEFTGGLDFARMEYVKGNRLTLKFSPAVTQDLPKELSVFKDEKGIASVDFELVGALQKPIPNLRLEKPFEASVGKLKVKVEAKKVEIETKAQEELQKAKEQTQEQLKEEAQKKVKEILKF